MSLTTEKRYRETSIEDDDPGSLKKLKKTLISELFGDFWNPIVIDDIKDPYDVSEAMEDMEKDPYVSKAIEDCKVPLFDYQERHVRSMCHPERHGGVLCYDTGCGKTLTSIVISCVYRARSGCQVHVVTPKSLIENFKSGMRIYGLDSSHPDYFFYTYSAATKALKENPLLFRGHLVICDEAHHLRTAIYPNMRQSLKRYINKVSNIPEDERNDTEKLFMVKFKDISKTLTECAKTKISDPISTVRRKTGFDISHIAGKSLILLDAARHAVNVVLLTATPVYNEPYDVANLVSMCHGLGVISKSHFENMEYRDASLLKNIFAFVHVDKDDPNFPTVRKETVEIPMDKEYYRKYREVETRQNSKWGNPWSFYSGIRQSTLGISPNPKVQWTIEKILLGQKTLVYSAFITHGLKMVQSHLQSLGIEFKEITGEIDVDSRSEAVRIYNESETMNVIFVSSAGGEGLDLKGTRQIILLESGWNLAQENQVIGRGPRRGSHTHLPKEEQVIDVYRLHLTKPKELDKDDNHEGSADKILAGIIERKCNTNDPFLKKLYSFRIV